MTERDDWELDMNGGPIFVQIGANVRRLLAREVLLPGEKLPSARDLATRLGVNPNTVVHAYGELERMDVIETRRGLGSFVREDAPIVEMRDELLRAAAQGFANEIERLGVPTLEALAVLKEVLDAGKAG